MKMEARNPWAGQETKFINTTKLLALYGGNPEIAGKVLQAVSSEVNQGIHHLRESLLNQDATALRNLAHKIKGALHNCGVLHLAEKAELLEKAAEAENLPSLEDVEEFAASLREFAAEASELIASLIP